MIGNIVPLFSINSCFMYIAFPVCRNNSLHMGYFNDLSAVKLIFRCLFEELQQRVRMSDISQRND